MKKRFCSFAAILIACLFPAACGSEEVSPLKEDTREYTFRVQDIPMFEDEEAGGEFVSLFAGGGRVFYVTKGYGPEGPGCFLNSVDLSGGDPSVTMLSQPVSAFETGTAEYMRFTGDGEGKLYGLVSDSTYDEQTGQQEYAVHIYELSEDGGLKADHDITGDILDNTWDYYMVENFQYTTDGSVIISTDTGVFSFDPADGGIRTIYKSPNEYMSASVKVLRDGRILVGKWAGEVYETRLLDPQTGEFSEPLTMPEDVSGASFYPGREHDLYFFRSGSLYYYDLGQKDKHKIMDFMASDVVADSLDSFADAGGDTLALVTSVWSAGSGGQTALKLCEHIPASEVKEKREITISCVYVNSEITKLAMDFNKTSQDYRIRIVDYSQYRSDSDWAYPYKKLNSDIIAGNIPDLLVVDSELPVESYISKGILMDLSEFLEQDERFTGAEFLNNVFDAYRIDGKLYYLIPSFSVYTGIMSKDVAGIRTEIAMSDLEELCGLWGIDIRNCFGTSMTRDQLFSILLYIQGAEFIDLSTGKCDFNSKEFIDLLELVKKFPKESDQNELDDAGAVYRDGRSLMMLYGLGSIRDYNRIKYGSFGTDITMTGIPGGHGSGSVVLPSLQIAVTTSAEDLDAVWEFLGMFLGEDYQDEISWGFPVRKESLRKKAEKAKEKPYYLDEMGQKVEYDDTWWVGTQEVIIPQPSDEEIAEVLDFLEKCDRRIYVNSTVTDIINEESAAFFEGQKTAEEVAAIIQSRAQIYVHENR